MRLEVVDARRAGAGRRSAGPRASARRARRSASDTAGRRITWRPTPTSAAFGRVCSGGTLTTRSSRAGARQASRQPARSSSGLNARGSTGSPARRPRSTWTLHFLHVPWPPHVESIAMPFQLAASKIGVPLGTRTSVPSGRKRSRTRSAPSTRAPASSIGLLLAARSCGAAGSRRGRPPSPPARSRCAAIQRAPHSSWPSSRSAARTALDDPSARAHDRARQPGRHRHRQEAPRSARGGRGRPKDTFEAPEAHVHAELVADEADRLERDRHRVGGGADRHRQRVDDDVLGPDAVVAGGRDDLARDLEALLRRLGDAGLVVGEADDRRAVLARRAAGSPRGARPRR